MDQALDWSLVANNDTTQRRGWLGNCLGMSTVSIGMKAMKACQSCQTLNNHGLHLVKSQIALEGGEQGDSIKLEIKFKCKCGNRMNKIRNDVLTRFGLNQA